MSPWFQREVYLTTVTEKQLRVVAAQLRTSDDKVSPGELISVAWRMLVAMAPATIYTHLERHGFLTADQRELIPLVAKGLIKQSQGKSLKLVNRATGGPISAHMMWIHVPTYQALAARAKELFVTKQSLCASAATLLVALPDEQIQTLRHAAAEALNLRLNVDTTMHTKED